VLWSVGGSCRIENRDVGAGIMVELTVPLTTTGAAFEHRG